MADYGKMSKSQLLNKYGSFIKKNFGKKELDFVKGEDTGGVRKYIQDLDPEPVKKEDGGEITKNLKKAIKGLKPSDMTKIKKVPNMDKIQKIGEEIFGKGLRIKKMHMGGVVPGRGGSFKGTR